MRYQIGDVIRIREDLDECGSRDMFEGEVGYHPDMAQYARKKVTITGILTSRNAYRILEDNGRFMWSEDMIDEYIKEKEEITKEVEHNAIEQINKADVIANMKGTLDFCEIYHPTENGLNTIYNEWARNKGEANIWNGMSVLDILAKHPHYVPEKGYIVKKAEYDRFVDFNVINDVMDNIICAASLLMEEVQVEPFSYEEVSDYRNLCCEILGRFQRFGQPEYVTYKGMTYEYVQKEYAKWSIKEKELENAYAIINYHTYTKESYEKYSSFRAMMKRLNNWINSQFGNYADSEENCTQLVIDSHVVGIINDSSLGIRGIREGQTFNKVIGKILREMKLDSKWVNYNREMARLGDASTPLKYTRFTILSANPVDFWRMSFGSSWSSCHTIDKLGNFSASRGGQSYDGMHGSGTESYMLDNSTLIMYTVDKDYDGNDYELQPKINRCLFHVGEGKFIMGRIYPQGKDGEKDVYKQWRNIFQAIMAECLDVPNYWKTEYDKRSKLNQIDSCGTHYEDYAQDYCDIAGWSWHKPFSDSKPSNRTIFIGHYPICPCCGSEHDVENNIECERCGDDGEYIERCYNCGDRINTEYDSYETDGNGRYWCCLDCANNDGYYMPVDSDEYYVVHRDYLHYDAYDGDYYYYGDDGIETPNGNWYHSEYNANQDGWYEYEGDWYEGDEFEDDALTGESFPYWADTCGFVSYETEDGDTLYFINDENKANWIAENVESEVA